MIDASNPHGWIPGRGTLCLAVLLTLVAGAIHGCSVAGEGSPKPLVVPGGDPLRDVRVLVAFDAQRVRLRADGGLTVLEDEEGRETGSISSADWLVIRYDATDGLRCGDRSVTSGSVKMISTAGDSVWLSLADGTGWSEPIEYPGSFDIRSVPSEGLVVTSKVDVERYVETVVGWEVWPTFHTEAFRAQAIACRSYVIYRMTRRNAKPWDIVATQGDQVYRGIRRDETGRRAREAARHTRGLVCSWRSGGIDRLFPTYYSAACGGVSQSAAIFGSESDIPPLAGGVRCNYCRIAPGNTYRWGPIRVSRRTLWARLTAKNPELAAVESLDWIRVTKRTPAGRPVQLRMVGGQGRSREISAERFRMAVGAETMFSTDCDIRIDGSDVIFEHGRGFGHGLGLCQWGMQGQALAGKKAGAILRYYYPGSRLTRVY